MEENVKIPFDNLLPKNDLPITNESTYKALEYALSDKRINNIGITGNYGAGKSSFILSFFHHKQLEEKCLNVSLASFSFNSPSANNNGNSTVNENELKNEENEDLEISESENLTQEALCDEEQNKENFVKLSKEQLQNIELSILHQIIYKESISDLPNSRLPRISGFSTNDAYKILKNITCFITFLVLIITSFKIHLIPNIKEFAITPIKIGLFICGVIGIFVPFKNLCIWMIKKIANISLKKISFKNAEVELDSYASESILNQRLDEILYFFEQTTYEYVIFEDLDRFNSNQIFIPLREINKIINENSRIKNSRTIKFIYAVKDQMFKDEERVKFFDFIIPIVPIINSSSAASELITQAKQNPKYFLKIDSDYLTEMGNFINDMRLLKNILNEYYVYHDIIRLPEENNIKLFSLIIYKNLYPIDFSFMQKKSGCLQQAFDKKKMIVDSLKQKSNEKINKYLADIEKGKKEKLTSIFELRIIYLTEYMRQKHHEVNSNQIYNLCSSGFEKFLESGTFISIDRYNRQIPTTFDSGFFKDMHFNGQTYFERATVLDIGLEKEINRISRLINAEKEYQAKISKALFHELSKSIDVDILHDLNLTRTQKYFLKRGFIDENYRDYISIFHEGVLSVSDYEYVMSVRNGEITEYNLPLNNTEQIFEKIKDVFINCTPGLLNYCLIDFLLERVNNYKQELDFLIDYFISEKNLKFLNSYIEDNNFEKLLSYSIINVVDFWRKIEDRNDNVELLNNISLCILKSLVDKKINNLNNNEHFTEYIMNHSETLTKLNSDDDIIGIFSVINNLNIKFKYLDKGLFEYDYLKTSILNECCFEINYQNLFMVANHIETKKIGVYSKIICSGYEELKNYINSNIYEVYVNLFVNNSAIEEDESSFITLINDLNITLEEKGELISKYNGKFCFIRDFTDKDLCTFILINNKAEVSWENILVYYTHNEKKLNEVLINFIIDKNNLSELENELSPDGDKSADYINLLTTLYQQKAVDEIIVSKLEEKNNYQLNTFDITSISEKKLKVLVECNSLRFEKSILENLRGLNQDFADLYIYHNIQEYLSNTENYILKDSEFSYCVNSDLKEDIKIELLKHNLDIACSVDTKLRILELIKKANLYDNLSKTNVLNLLHSKQFEFGDTKNAVLTLKGELLINTHSLFSNEEIQDELENLDPDFAKIRLQQTATLIDKSNIINDICEMLANRNIIISVKKDKKKLILRIK